MIKKVYVLPQNSVVYDEQYLTADEKKVAWVTDMPTMPDFEEGFDNVLRIDYDNRVLEYEKVKIENELTEIEQLKQENEQLKNSLADLWELVLFGGAE